MSTKVVPPPGFVGKSYEQYRVELDAWESITDVAKGKQAVTVAFSLPEDHESRIREKVFTELKLEDLNKDDGLKTLTTFLDKKLKVDDISDSWSKFNDFDECAREGNQSINEFIVKFDEKYKKIVKKGITLPSEIVAFMMLKRSHISKDERLLVLTGMDYSRKDELYEQAQISLKKFKGDQAHAGASSSESIAIKLEPAFLAENEEALLSAGYQRIRRGNGYYHGNNSRQRERSSDSNNRGRGGNRGNDSRQRERSSDFNSDGVIQREDTGGRGGRGGRGRGAGRSENARPMNPVGSDGNVLTCAACGSFRHLIAICPYSYENINKVLVVEEVVDDDKDVDVILYTGNKKEEIAELGKESRNCMVLDSACTNNVGGQLWLDCYLDSLDEYSKSLVKYEMGKKRYKFGGGEVLRSTASVQIPAEVAGIKQMIEMDVVESSIPLLWSLKDMKKAKVKLDLANDTAEIYGNLVNLNYTSAGHYCLPILPTETSAEVVNAVELTKLKPDELNKTLTHLHRQFAHPPEKKLIALLENAGIWKKDYQDNLTQIYLKCDLCKKYAKTPPRPVVGLPMASRFNEKVAMDLKKWEGRWILHLVDMFTRFTVSMFIERKLPSEVIEKIMIHWVGAGFGVMEGILSDNGGEFSSEETREVASILNVIVNTTAAESPFQNGLCERIHSVTDMMLTKLRAEHPGTAIEVLLCWACNARNALQMWHGYSSYQLVFGKNPNLPNIMTSGPPALEGSTTSEVLAKHLNVLHSARQAFIKSESDERIRRALRHKIRASEQRFENGDLVYYKRQGQEKWLGPGKVVFQDGRVVFVRHGGTFVRVSPNHLIKNTDEALGAQKDENITHPNAAAKSVNKERNAEAESDDEVENPSSPGSSNRGSQNLSDSVNNSGPLVDESHRAEQKGDSPSSHKEFPRKGERIQYKCGEDWENVVVLGRGGKATASLKNYYNLEKDNGEQLGRDLSDKSSWRYSDEAAEDGDGGIEDVNVVAVPKDEHLKEECVNAKEAELEKLKKFDAYDIVEDHGQFRISSTWVLTRKGEEIRARLVARGFEEEVDIQKDSPTIGRSTLRLFLTIAASEKWTIRSTDIQSAFLQGKTLDRDVYMTPPKEAKVEKKCLWKLKHCLYGLTDAARQFYLSVEECLMSAGCGKSRLDPALFYYRVKNQLCGLVACHVDDFAHVGNEVFYQDVLRKVHSRFIVSSVETGAFKYIGFGLTQNPDGSILLDQNEYVSEITTVPMASERKQMNEHELTKDEYTTLRSLVGKVNWVVQGSRPDVAFDMTELSTKLKKACVGDLTKAIKCIKKLKFEDSNIVFPALNKIDEWKIIVFTDASHANLSGGTGSMGAHVVFLVDEHGNSCPLTWQAGKIKRVVRSTLAAEALSLAEGIEDAIFLKQIFCELLPVRSKICIDVYIDNRDAVDAI